LIVIALPCFAKYERLGLAILVFDESFNVVVAVGRGTGLVVDLTTDTGTCVPLEIFHGDYRCTLPAFEDDGFVQNGQLSLYAENSLFHLTAGFPQPG
jgi:hypothetical protein